MMKTNIDSGRVNSFAMRLQARIERRWLKREACFVVSFWLMYILPLMLMTGHGDWFARFPSRGPNQRGAPTSRPRLEEARTWDMGTSRTHFAFSVSPITVSQRLFCADETTSIMIKTNITGRQNNLNLDLREVLKEIMESLDNRKCSQKEPSERWVEVSWLSGEGWTWQVHELPDSMADVSIVNGRELTCLLVEHDKSKCKLH